MPTLKPAIWSTFFDPGLLQHRRKYIELVQSKKWGGIGHEASTFKLSLVSGELDSLSSGRRSSSTSHSRSTKGTITVDPTKRKKALRALQMLVEMIGGAGDGDSDDDSAGSGDDDDDIDNDASASNDSTSEHAKTVLLDGLFDVFEMSKG